MWFWLAVSAVLIASLFAVLAVVFAYVDRAKMPKYLIATAISGGMMIFVLSQKPFPQSLEQTNINMYQHFLRQYPDKNRAAQAKQEKKDQQPATASVNPPANQKGQPAKESETASPPGGRKETGPKTEKTSAGPEKPGGRDTDKAKSLIVVGSGTEKQNPPAAENKNDPSKPGGNTGTGTPAQGGTQANTPSSSTAPAVTPVPAPVNAQPAAAASGTAPAGAPSTAVKRGQIIHHANFRTSKVIGEVAKVLPPGTIVDLIDPYNPSIMIKVMETATGQEGWVFGQFVKPLD